VSEHTTPNGGCLLLWAAVIHQALEDLDGQPYGSVTHDEAVAFFTRTGPWGGMREEIADRVDLHADDLRRIGQSRITARTAREPSPAKVPPVALSSPQPYSPPPQPQPPPQPPPSPPLSPLPAQLPKSIGDRPATEPFKAKLKSAPQRERYVASWLQKWIDSAANANGAEPQSRLKNG
jgi:hypothetical protein